MSQFNLQQFVKEKFESNGFVAPEAESTVVVVESEPSPVEETVRPQSVSNPLSGRDGVQRIKVSKNWKDDLLGLQVDGELEFPGASWNRVKEDFRKWGFRYIGGFEEGKPQWANEDGFTIEKVYERTRWVDGVKNKGYRGLKRVA